MKIAISGKGGVGKTTLASNIIKYLAKQGKHVTAIDADPDSSLGYTLGISPEELTAIPPLCDLEDEIKATMGEGAIYTLNPDVKAIPDKYCIKLGNIRLLRMGSVKAGGSECYCRENMFLKAVASSLVLDSQEIVVMDMGAGIEHLTRGTSESVDKMLIVTEAGRASVQTARVVESLARQMGIKEIGFVANKIKDDDEKAFILNSFTPQELIGIISYDPQISKKGMGIGINDEVDNIQLEQVVSKLLGQKG